MTCPTAQERLEKGERLFLLGNLANAQEIFESIINEEESSKEAYNNLGVIAYRHRELEKAFRYFIKALRIDPRYEDAVENLCRLKGEIKKDGFLVGQIKTDAPGSLTALHTASRSIHHLDTNVRLITNRKEYFVDYCKSKSVLHIGCVGSGSIEERLRDGSHLHCRLSRVTSSLVGIDINAEGIDVMKRAGFEDCLVGDIEHDEIDPELAANMDVILVPEVLEHLSNPGLFLDHLKILNYRGDILISVPNAFSYRTASYLKNMGMEFVHPDHHFYFSPTTLRTLLEKHGFSILTLALYYWQTNDEFGRMFETILQNNPYMAEGVIALLRDSRHIVRTETPHQKSSFAKEMGTRTGDRKPTRKSPADQRTATPFKLHYSPGIAHHGEKMRRMLNLGHYVPSIHISDPVWFFGLYFDQDYLQVLAHGGKKILNWRGSDALRLKSNSWRVQIVKNLQGALHVCQSHRQQEVLAGIGLSSIVRPMINEIISDINLTPFPEDRTRILVFWKRGIDDFIRADLFFEVALRSQDVEFHIVGDESPLRFAGPGKENLIYHGFLSEKDLDRLMDQCKGTLRPWISDGTPNIQTKMLLKGRYAAHGCQFEKVALCSNVDEYVAWIEWLKGVEVQNLEAREWWMNHLNNFDFLDPGFDAAKQGEGEKA